MELPPNWKLIRDPKKAGGQGTILVVQNITDPKLKGALKKIHPDQQHKEIKRERMCREIASLKKISFRGIPKIYDDNATDVANPEIPLFFVSEWIEGKTLHEIYLKKPTSIDEAIRITRDLCLIVDTCHRENILHRDIKPQNIIISNDGVTYLVDFGLAWIKPITESESEFNSYPNEEISNYFLRLPEYITGYKKHNQVSDITYLVGILFFLLTGQYPKGLTDGDGTPPHKILTEHLPKELLSDIRWQKIKRIFDLGFVASIKHRFTSAIDLIKMLDEINKAEEGAEQKIENNPQVLKLQELLNSTVLKTKENVFKTMVEANLHLHQRLTELAKKVNLTTPSNTSVGEDFRSVFIQFSNHNHSIESVHFTHNLQLADSNGTKLRATYSFNKEQPTFYYSGYSSDKEGLITAIDNKIDDMFLEIVEAYTKKTRKPQSLF